MVHYTDITELGIVKGAQIRTEKGTKCIVLGLGFKFNKAEFTLSVNTVMLWETGVNEGKRLVDAESMVRWVEQGRMIVKDWEL